MDHNEDLVDFCTSRLEEILNCPISKEIADYILSIEDKSELNEFLGNFVGEANPNLNQFVVDLIMKRELINHKQGVSNKAYKKPPEGDYIEAQSKPNKKSKSGKSFEPVAQSSNEDQSKKKTHFVPLFNQQGAMKDMPILPGRHSCNCEATKHELINNCIECGRIVCQQEGSGPCLTCGALVCTPEEQEILNRGSKKSTKLQEKLLNLPKPEEESQLAKAIAHKNKLLDFNQTSALRTKIVDDDIDYFSIDKIKDNKWISQDQKKVLLKKAENLKNKQDAAKSNRVIGIDFINRKIIDADKMNTQFDSEVDELKRLADNFSSLQFSDDTGREFNINPTVAEAPQYDEDNRHNLQLQKAVPAYIPPKSGGWHQAMRIQDRELQEIQDNGMCLSMHQPWASMLVMGIKIHEGRTWYTPHRGCLWIHAASKVPDSNEVIVIENSHRSLKGNEHAVFPEQYPVSSLLGCVIVTDCLEQEEYRQIYPDGESLSPYVLICENPMELLIKFPMKGKHKIFPLDSQIHHAAKKTLRKYVGKH